MLNIVWDIDSVLNNFEEEWFKYYKYINFNKYDHIQFNQLIENPPHKILGITKEEYLTSLNYFRKNYIDHIQPNRLILSWLNKYGNKINSSVLTSALYPSIENSAYWFFKYFKKYIRNYIVIPSYIEDDPNKIIFDKTKMDYIKRIGNIDIFIDDNENNINEVKNNLPYIQTFVPKQPWNNGKDINVILQEIVILIYGEDIIND